MAVGHIFIYGEIGTRAGQVSLKSVKDQINTEASEYVVHIVSPGGDVFEGYAIYNALKNLGKPVTTNIEGLCASIATLIAAAANKIVMNRVGQFMIHNPSITDLKGDANQLRSVANQLDQIKSVLISVYRERTGMSDEKLWELYDNETYMTADQAQQLGFVDESVDAIKAVAFIDSTKIKMKESLFTQIKNLFSKAPNKAAQIIAQMSETLADGRVVIVMSDDEDWTGKGIVLESGEPLPSGNYELASGKTITVTDGIITEVSTPDSPEDMKKIEELEQQLAEAKAALEQATAAAASAQASTKAAEAKAASFENKVNALSKDFIAIQEQMKQAYGDTSPAPKGPSVKNAKDQKVDPMGDFALEFYRSRNLVN